MKSEMIDQIVKYLSGRMTDEEQRIFYRQLEHNNEMSRWQLQVRLIAELMTVTKIFSKRKLKTDLQELERKIELEERGKDVLKKKGRFSRWWKWMLGGFVILVLLRILLLAFTDGLSLKKSVSKHRKDSMIWDGYTRTVVLPVIAIKDSRPGFVARDTTGVITIFEEVVAVFKDARSDSFLLVGADSIVNRFPESYLFTDSTLCLRLMRFDSAVQFYQIHVESQVSESVGANGELVYVEKPTLKGEYIFLQNQFYKIERRQEFELLSKVDEVEFELLKYYTEK